MLAGSAGPAYFYLFFDKLLSGGEDALLRQTELANRFCHLPSFAHLYYNRVTGKRKKLIVAVAYGFTVGNLNTFQLKAKGIKQLKIKCRFQVVSIYLHLLLLDHLGMKHHPVEKQKQNKSKKHTHPRGFR